MTLINCKPKINEKKNKIYVCLICALIMVLKFFDYKQQKFCSCVINDEKKHSFPSYGMQIAVNQITNMQHHTNTRKKKSVIRSYKNVECANVLLIVVYISPIANIYVTLNAIKSFHNLTYNKQIVFICLSLFD